MARVLRNIQLREISLVDRPANPHARVLIAKRADDPKEKGMKKPDLSKLSEEDRAAVEKAMADAERTGALEKENAELKKAAPKVDPPAPKPEEVLKGVSPEVQQLFKGLQDQVSTLQEQSRSNLAKATALEDERRSQEFLAKAKAFVSVGDPKQVGELLKKVAAVDPATATALEGIFKATHERISKGQLFTEIGASGAGAGGGSAQSQVITLAKAKQAEIKKAGGADVSLADAIAEVYREKPELYQQASDEAAVAAK